MIALVPWRATSRAVPFVALVLIAATACNPYRCVYKTRFVSTEPVPTSTPAGTFSGWVNLRDYSDGQPIPVSIGWNLQITGSTATITSLTLRDRRDMSTVLATMAVSSGGTSASSAPPLETRAERDATFGVLVSGNAVLVAETSGSATPTLIPLAVVGREDWHRPTCS